MNEFLGNSSNVFLATYFNGIQEKNVAVKTVYNKHFNNDDVLREIVLISTCKHRNIVEYVGYYPDLGGIIHIVTEYMGGGDLHRFLMDEINVRFIRKKWVWS
jgi:serine/threonine protein kinase